MPESAERIPKVAKTPDGRRDLVFSRRSCCWTCTPNEVAPLRLMFECGRYMRSRPRLPELLDRQEDRGHAGLVLDLLEQLLADEKGLDAFLDDLRHGPRNHEGRVLNIQSVGDRDGLVFGSVRPRVQTGGSS